MQELETRIILSPSPSVILIPPWREKNPPFPGLRVDRASNSRPRHQRLLYDP